jgi:hypothetical protein
MLELYMKQTGSSLEKSAGNDSSFTERKNFLYAAVKYSKTSFIQILLFIDSVSKL